jgi:Transglycosylase SLT domain
MLAAAISNATPTPAQAVSGAIQQAASATGTSFEYLLATAQVESGFDPHAAANTTSARGLFQFIEQTWLGTMKQAGPSLGYGKYADAITRTRSGRYVVNDPAMRRAILKLRQDPAANAVMAGAFTRANADYLNRKLGRGPSESELYIAHFLGAGGAGKLIALASKTPQASAAELFPGAARANHSIFYDRSGHARSLAGVVAELSGRYKIARALPAQPEAPAVAAPVASANPAPVPDTAALANAFATASPQAPTPAAKAQPIFGALFHDTKRRSPIAPAVSALWSSPPGKPLSLAPPPKVKAAAAPATAAAVQPAATSANPAFDLFRQFVRDVRAIFGA